jgi:hypothetical protein
MGTELFPGQVFENLVDHIGGALAGTGHINAADNNTDGDYEYPDGQDHAENPHSALGFAGGKQHKISHRNPKRRRD